MKYKLSELAFYSTEKIEIDKVDESNYISTENILPNKSGICLADKLPQIKKVNAYKNGDILISNIRPYFKKIWFANRDGGHSADVLNFRAKEGVSNRFLYALLFQDSFFNQMVLSSKGTKMPRGDKNAIMNLEFEVPSYSKQEKISDILFYFQDKIELNNQIISNLEELASTLFKRWFVDFEFPDENGNPYKSSGGKMVDSELGEIPEGWHIDIISNLMENFDRKRVPLSKMQREKRKGEYPYYGAASLMDYVDDFLFDGIHLLLGEDGTVITKEGNPVLQYVWGKFWVNNHAHVLKGRGYVSTEWLYLWFKQTNVSGIVTGAVQPKISQTNLNRLKVVFPDKELLIKFQKNIGIMFDKLVVLSNEMTTLTELRDTLLPRLLSGEIELSEDGEV
ncbi:restriction endonuclease subunit S [Enterococcus faecalis]|uniref:restriction endonuclease subunit S n=1 Tax=Enterococcus faecalis TaxID=1351 RepID=UPI0025B0E76F|nr:restriction endonuclease subunit S [Enterococcus faecalis]MDN3106482.1 restriction endonuclease subunit S [Enterococcus faecalis]